MNRAHVSLMLCLCIASLASGAQNPQPRGKEIATSTVRIVPVGISGTEIDVTSVKVESFKPQSGAKDLAALFRGNPASGIPYGIYKVRMRVPGFWSGERELRVFQSEVRAVVALEIGTLQREGGLQTSSISGHVQNTNRTAGPLRIRLTGVYSSTIVDAEVKDSGEFRLAEVPNGRYVLVAIQHDKVLTVRAIDLPIKEALVIDAGDRSTANLTESKQ